MYKKIKILIIIVILIILILLGFMIANKIKFDNKDTNIQMAEEITNIQTTEEIEIVPTMSDTIMADSSWCGTFQLVWNDMKNEIVKKDIIFNPQLDMVSNLNKEEFNEIMNFRRLLF